MRPSKVARDCLSSCRYVLFLSCTCITLYLRLVCNRKSEWQVRQLGDLSHWCLLQVRIQPPCIDPLLTLIMYKPSPSCEAMKYVLFRLATYICMQKCSSSSCLWYFLTRQIQPETSCPFFFHVAVNLCFSTLMQMFIWSSTIQGGNWPLGDGS